MNSRGFVPRNWFCCNQAKWSRIAWAISLSTGNLLINRTLIMRRVKFAYYGLNVGIVAVAMICSLRASLAWAGAGPMPLEAQLDLAQDVVCGELIKLEPIPEVGNNSVHLAIATVAISETLKGDSVGKIKFRVIVKVDSEYEGAAVLQSHRLGEVGIWSIAADGTIDNTYGLLPLERRDEVQRILMMLAERKWSEPVEGVQIWVMEVAKEAAWGHGRAILAVRNCSDAVVYFPVPTQYGFVKLTKITKAGEETTDLHPGFMSRRVYCHPLAPGEIRYIHPVYSFISLTERGKAPVGVFQFVLSCQNSNELGQTGGTGPTSSVRAWCGKLQTAPIAIRAATDKD
jgi:hypothetical protein